MIIHNINELATAFETYPRHLGSTLSNLARTDLTIDNAPTYLRISHLVGECNTDISITCRYPFNSRVITTFLNTLDSTVGDMLSIYDDPIDMLMNMTNPGEQWTLEDAAHCLSEAEASGWVFPPDVDAQYILDIYNDMEPEKEE